MKRFLMTWGGFVLTAIVVVCIAARPAYTFVRVSYTLHQAKKSLIKLEPEKAVALLEKAESIDPGRAEIQFLLVTANRRAGQINAAMRHFERARTLGWRRKDLEREQCMLLFQSGQIKEGDQYLQGILLDPSVPDDVAEELYEVLYRTYLADFRVREAKLCVDHWIEWKPESTRAHLLRAEFMQGMRDPQSEMAEYRSILEYDPRSFDARVRLAELLMEGNQMNESLREFQVCMDQDPDNLVALLGMAVCLRRVNREKEARPIFERLIEHEEMLPRERALCLRELAQLSLEHDRDSKRAVELLEEAVVLLPTDPTVHYALGRALYGVKRDEKGKAHVDESEKLRKILTRLADIQNELAMRPKNELDLRFEAAKLSLDGGMKEECVAMLMGVLRADPAHVEAHKMLARLYAKEGNEKLAKRHRAMAAGRVPPPELDAPPMPSLPPLPVEFRPPELGPAILQPRIPERGTPEKGTSEKGLPAKSKRDRSPPDQTP